MGSTSDKIIKALLSQFRETVRPVIQRGGAVNLDDCLEQAIARVKYVFSRDKYDERSIMEHIWPEEDMIRERCKKIILEIEKRERLLDIRMTSVESIMEEFSKTSGFKLHYKLRGNSTAGISVRLPETGQTLHFSTSFSKVLSDGWMDSMKEDLTEFLELSSRFGKIRMTKGY